MSSNLNIINSKCSNCKCYFIPTIKSSGLSFKTCDKCRTKDKETRRCEHDKRKSVCKECGGGSICEHNKIKSRCKACGGSQINSSVNKTYEYKITAPPRTFQIDIFWFKKGESLIPILLLVDILSRKAWAYVLSKSKKEKRAAVSVKTLQEFKNEVGLIHGLTGDNEFSSASIKKFCEDNNIRLDTSVAKEEHISNGNKLGIIDRLVRTLRELIDKYFDITGHRTDNIKEVVSSVIETYNNNSHRTLQNKTPNQVYNDIENQTARHITDSLHNQQIYEKVPFDEGQKSKSIRAKREVR